MHISKIGRRFVSIHIVCVDHYRFAMICMFTYTKQVSNNIRYVWNLDEELASLLSWGQCPRSRSQRRIGGSEKSNSSTVFFHQGGSEDEFPSTFFGQGTTFPTGFCRDLKNFPAAKKGEPCELKAFVPWKWMVPLRMEFSGASWGFLNDSLFRERVDLSEISLNSRSLPATEVWGFYGFGIETFGGLKCSPYELLINKKKSQVNSVEALFVINDFWGLKGAW